MRIILVGKAASGKDFYRDYVAKTQRLDVSYTTRPIRDGEEDGYTYNFLTEAKFNEMAEKGQFFENVKFNGWSYGTSMQSWNHNSIFIMTPSGVKQIPTEDRAECIVVYFDIDEEVRKARLSTRSDADKTKRRLRADLLDFKGFNDFDIRVRNPLFNPIVVSKLIKEYSHTCG